MVLAMACFGLADYVFDYRSILATPEARKKVADAAATLKGSAVDFRGGLTS